MKIRVMLSLMLLFLSNILHAQRTRDYFSIGLGPSVIVGDNTANYPDFNFKISPSMGIGYNEQLSHHFDVRATLGLQILHSGNTFDQIGFEDIPKVVDWGLAGQAKDFRGQAMYLDVMPVYNFRPVLPIMVGYPWLYYVGGGIGIMHVTRNEEIMIGINNIDQEDFNIMMERRTTTAAYFPLRAGVSTNLEKDYDVGLEFSAFVTTSSSIDGNNIRRKIVGADMLFQLQLIAKIYLGW